MQTLPEESDNVSGADVLLAVTVDAGEDRIWLELSQRRKGLPLPLNQKLLLCNCE